MKTYKGIPYRVTKFHRLTIIEGYDRGYRVIYAMSQKEFRAKVARYLKDGITDQSTPWNRRCTVAALPTMPGAGRFNG